jgi:hypothetical protein
MKDFSNALLPGQYLDFSLVFVIGWFKQGLHMVH